MNPEDQFDFHAGLDRRFWAFFLDILLLYGAIFALQFGLQWITGRYPLNLFTTGPRIEAWILLTVSFPTWLYIALSESSNRGATLGKRLLRLRVTDTQGESISFGRAALRTVFKMLPWELTHVTYLVPAPWHWDPSPGLRPTIFLVYLLLGAYLLSIIFSTRQQSLYDLLVGTFVIHSGSGAG